MPLVKPRGKAANSDHYWFTEKGVPAFFIYTMGGIKAYHDVYDVAATLPLTKYEELRKLLIAFARGKMGSKKMGRFMSSLVENFAKIEANLLKNNSQSGI